MKRLSLLFLFCTTTLLSFAFGPLTKKGENNQWVILGLRATANSTWLYNQNQFNDKGIRYQASWGWSGGAMLGLHYTSWGAICVEGLYSTIAQKQKSGIDSIPWSSRRDLSYLELPVLLHFVPKEFSYIEVGVKLATLKKATGTYSSPDLNFSKQNAMGDFEASNTSIVFGWGNALWGDGGGLVTMGIRLTYGITDLVAAGRGNNYYALQDGQEAAAKSYKSTNSATIGFHFTYDFDMGWFMYNDCKRKYKFFLFKH